MPTIQETIEQLEVYFSLVQQEEAKKATIPRKAFRYESQYDKVIHGIDEAVKSYRRDIESCLQQYDREPERHYLRHGHDLAKLHAEGSFEESVFIMTKFPSRKDLDAKVKNALELQAVIDAVMRVVSALHYKPRIAHEHEYKDWIWDNVELFLFGCARGIDQDADYCRRWMESEWRSGAELPFPVVRRCASRRAGPAGRLVTQNMPALLTGGTRGGGRR